LAKKSRAIIRQESINDIPFMSQAKRANIQTRIFDNEDITGANARVQSKIAGGAERRAKFALDRTNSIVRHYKEDVQEVEKRIMTRFKTLRGSGAVPRAPILLTMQRSLSRRQTREHFSRNEPFEYSRVVGGNDPFFWGARPKGSVNHPAPFTFKGMRRPMTESEARPLKKKYALP